jgi:hypothetical protein
LFSISIIDGIFIFIFMAVLIVFFTSRLLLWIRILYHRDKARLRSLSPPGEKRRIVRLGGADSFPMLVTFVTLDFLNLHRHCMKWQISRILKTFVFLGGDHQKSEPCPKSSKTSMLLIPEENASLSVDNPESRIEPVMGRQLGLGHFVQ